MSRRCYATLAILCLLSPVVHLIALGPSVPEGTFILIGELPDLELRDDPSNLVYSYARAPIYALTGWMFSNPLAFLLFGSIAHGVFHAVLFAVVYQGIRSSGVAGSRALSIAVPVLLTFIVFPVCYARHLTGHGVTLIPHDAFLTFSMRTPFWIAFGLAYAFWITGRRRVSLWVLGVSCWTHPSAGILAFGLASLAVVASSVRSRDRVLILHLLAAAALGAAPTVARFLFAGPSVEAFTVVGHAQWYSEMIKDEADDFSFLFQLLYRSHPVTLIVALVAGTLLVYARVCSSFRRDPSFWFAASVPVLFALGVAVECLFAVWVPTPAIELLIRLTPGYRFLSFAFFPLVVLWARLLYRGGVALEQRWPAVGAPRFAYGAAAAGLALSWSVLFGSGVSQGRTQTSLPLIAWAMKAGRVEGLDAYLAASAEAGRSAFWQPPLYELDDGLVSYPGERSLFRIREQDQQQPPLRRDVPAMEGIRESDFLTLVREVRRELPRGSGLFIPPYLRHFRDSLPRYRIFFQEHHDGNLMMGSPAFLGFFGGRMKELLGLSYEELPSKESRLSYSVMRRAYLSLDTNQVRGLASRHPDYGYWVTERSQRLDFEPVIEAGNLVVYSLRPGGDPPR